MSVEPPACVNVASTEKFMLSDTRSGLVNVNVALVAILLLLYNSFINFYIVVFYNNYIQTIA